MIAYENEICIPFGNFLFLSRISLSQATHLKKGDSLLPEHGLYLIDKASTQEKENTTKVFIRCGWTKQNSVPLLIIDGIPVEYAKLTKIDPNDISRIEVLRDSDAMAIYGYEASSGVIIVTTKGVCQKRFIIKDILNGKPISNATISFISKIKKDSASFIANDSGIVNINNFHFGRDYEIKTTAIGYKVYSTPLENYYLKKENELLLERDYKSLPEVVISPPGLIKCHLRCICYGITIIKTPGSLPAYDSDNKNFKLYPNPLPSNSILHIEWIQKEWGTYVLQLFNQPGQLVFSKELFIDKEAKVLDLSLPSVAPGNYFIRIVNQKSGKFYSEKLIFQ